MGDGITRAAAVSVPHAFPYQGSKRRLAGAILDAIGPPPRPDFRLVEPFAGSAAMSLATAVRYPRARFWINDALGPLAELWRSVLAGPDALTDGYETIWNDRREDVYERARTRFNQTGEPAALLYLLARCVKAAVRFNASGGFNQSADRRRRGVSPARLRAQLRAASALLAGRTQVTARDFGAVLAELGQDDLAYLDPPYEGTSTGTDRRYQQGLSRARLVEEIRGLLDRKIAFALSYDGKRGERSYGASLEADLGLAPRWLDAGISSQATLLGARERTVEALYLSPLPPRKRKS